MQNNIVRGIHTKLDAIVLDFKKQIELQMGREISYSLATKLIAEVITEQIYIKNLNIQDKQRKADRKMMFEVELYEKK